MRNRGFKRRKNIECWFILQKADQWHRGAELSARRDFQLMLSHVPEGLVRGESACFTILAMHYMVSELRNEMLSRGIPSGQSHNSTLWTISFGHVQYELDDAEMHLLWSDNKSAGTPLCATRVLSPFQGRLGADRVFPFKSNGSGPSYHSVKGKPFVSIWVGKEKGEEKKVGTLWSSDPRKAVVLESLRMLTAPNPSL